MKTQVANPRGSELGMTMPEFSVAMTVFFFVTAGLLTTHVFGLKMYELTRAKLGASADARKALALMVDEVRSARRVRVGQGDMSTFAEAGLTNAQMGNCLQIHATTNLSEWVRYYHDPYTEALMRYSDVATNPVVIVNSITNPVPFQAEDFRGTVLTNTSNNRVISVDLIFSQVPFAEEYSDYYRLRYKVTRRRIR